MQVVDCSFYQRRKQVAEGELEGLRVAPRVQDVLRRVLPMGARHFALRDNAEATARQQKTWYKDTTDLVQKTAL